MDEPKGLLGPVGIRGIWLWIITAVLDAPWLDGFQKFWLYVCMTFVIIDGLLIGAQSFLRWLERRATRVDRRS
jgi:hypothetical protein